MSESMDVVSLISLPTVVVEKTSDATGLYYRARWSLSGVVGPWMRSKRSAIKRLLTDEPMIVDPDTEVISG